ncbi:MAG: (2Fe-2S)-binding protein [Proteobacteria bacterium]|nr:(2Fe-2S)-binding protein [Pseudomonadota bacterium]
MLICHCKGVSDRAIRKAVREGATNASDVIERCGAGAGCGGCTEAVDEIVRSEAAHHERRALVVVPAARLATSA